MLLERGFSGNALTWLMPSLGTVDALAPIHAAPPNLRDEVCGKHRKKPASESDFDEDTLAAPNPTDPDRTSAYATINLTMRMKNGSLLSPQPPSMAPVVVFVGPPRQPRDTAIAAAPATQKPAQAAATAPLSASFAATPKPVKLRPKKPATAAKQDAAAPEPAAKPKPAAAKPAEAKPAETKPAAAKPKAAATQEPAAKPKPAPARQEPAAKPKAQSPATQPTAAKQQPAVKQQ
jgi:D-alanyl-D-alanine carboxypeptidase